MLIVRKKIITLHCVNLNVFVLLFASFGFGPCQGHFMYMFISPCSCKIYLPYMIESYNSYVLCVEILKLTFIISLINQSLNFYLYDFTYFKPFCFWSIMYVLGRFRYLDLWISYFSCFWNIFVAIHFFYYLQNFI